MKNRIVLFLLLALSCSQWACDRKELPGPCPDQEAFCNPLENGEPEATLPIVNAYLAGLPDNEPHALEQLVSWLECKDCVQEVEILCHSCIKTLPAQSEIRIKTASATLTMDILMGSKLSLLRYHD